MNNKSVMISVGVDQFNWCRDHHINISSFVRAQLEKYIKGVREYERKGENIK